MYSKNFGNVLTAMVTPFNLDLSINYSAAAKLAKYLIENGSDGVVLAGSTGESATLSTREKIKLFSVVLDAIGDKATVIAGTGSNDTKASIEITKKAEKIGIHGSMLVGPYYNKPPQEGFYQHFKAIAEETTLPLIIYNVPSRTGSNITSNTICRLSEIKNIIAIKEASSNLDQVTDIIKFSRKGFHVYSGEDSLTLPILSLGGTGVISVASHIVGKQIKLMIEEFYNCNTIAAIGIHMKLLPVFKAMFITTNPIPVKAALNLLGLTTRELRQPLIKASSHEIEQIKEVISEYL